MIKMRFLAVIRNVCGVILVLIYIENTIKIPNFGSMFLQYLIDHILKENYVPS